MKKKILFGVILAVALGAIVYIYASKNNKGSASDPSLKIVEQRGTLIVGSDIPYGAMELVDQFGNPAGVDVEITKEIANALGVKLVFKDYDWDRLFAAVKSGEIDIAASSITITEERQKEMLFSAPYFNGGQSIVTNTNNNNINSVSDIIGKNVGVQSGTTGFELAKKYVNDKSLFTFVDNSKIVDALRQKKIDLLITDYVEAKQIVKQDASLKIIGEPVTQEFYGIATRSGNNTLMDRVSQVLKEMKRDGRLERIKNKWLQ